MFLTAPHSTRISPAKINTLFSTDPALEVLNETDMWALDSPLVYRTEKGITITLPKGLITDLASIPKILDWVPALDINGVSRLAGVLHDGLYKIGRQMGKDFADNTLREALMSLGMSPRNAGFYYYGVHWFGGSAWSTDGKNLNYGTPKVSNFASKADYEAWNGAPIFTNPSV